MSSAMVLDDYAEGFACVLKGGLFDPPFVGYYNYLAGYESGIVKLKSNKPLTGQADKDCSVEGVVKP